jgi:hypothetical protein
VRDLLGRAFLGVVAALGVCLVWIGVATSAGNPLGDLTGSERFWSTFALDAVEAEHFESLAEMSASADAVVIATITKVTPGRVILAGQDDGFQYMNLSLRVDSQLAGAPLEADFVLEMMLPEGASADRVNALLPAERQILFLRSKEREAATLNYPARLIPREHGLYRLINLGQGRYSDLYGKVDAPRDAEDDWVQKLRGTPFERLAESAKAGAK